MAKENERIILGSGSLFLKLYDGKLPKVEEICVEENRFAYISGGCTLEYKPEFYEAVDDLGKVSKSAITKEDVLMKSGLMTFGGTALEKICDTARVSYREKEPEQVSKRRRVVKIGGLQQQGHKSYVLCFMHEDPVDGNIWVMIVGKNQAGFSLAFLKDKETIVDAEFKAEPHDKEGTLIYYEEEIPDDAAAAASVAKTEAPVSTSQTGKSK